MRKVLKVVSVLALVAAIVLAARAGAPAPDLVLESRRGRPWLVRPADHRRRDLRLAGSCVLLALGAGASWITPRRLS